MSKALVEKRNDLLDEMETLLENAKKENRAFKSNEVKRIETIKGNIAEPQRK